MKTSSRLFIALAATAGLGGCAVYPAPGYGAYDGYGGNAGPPYVVQQSPVYIQGGASYRSGYPRGYGGRDRDGDGVPNRRDAYPNNPNLR